MMTGPQHIRAAQALLSAAATGSEPRVVGGFEVAGPDAEQLRLLVDRASAHTRLAELAFQVEQLYGDTGSTGTDWRAAIGRAL